jgi:hypothetical protein
MMAMYDMPHVVTTLVIDVPVAFPQKLLRILCIEWQAAPPVVQAAATKLASDGARRRESVNKVHKKRSRANKRKRFK